MHLDSKLHITASERQKIYAALASLQRIKTKKPSTTHTSNRRPSGRCHFARSKCRSREQGGKSGCNSAASAPRRSNLQSISATPSQYGRIRTKSAPVTMTRMLPPVPAGWASRVTTWCRTFWKGRFCGILVNGCTRYGAWWTYGELLNDGTSTLDLIGLKGQQRVVGLCMHFVSLWQFC